MRDIIMFFEIALFVLTSTKQEFDGITDGEE